MSKRTTVEDVKIVADLVHRLRERAVEYSAHQSCCNFERLAEAGADLTEFVRNLKRRKSGKGE